MMKRPVPPDVVNGPIWTPIEAYAAAMPSSDVTTAKCEMIELAFSSSFPQVEGIHNAETIREHPEQSP